MLIWTSPFAGRRDLDLLDLEDFGTADLVESYDSGHGILPPLLALDDRASGIVEGGTNPAISPGRTVPCTQFLIPSDGNPPG